MHLPAITALPLYRVHAILNPHHQALLELRLGVFTTAEYLPQVLEQLLRLVPGIRRIYVIVRSRPRVPGGRPTLKPTSFPLGHTP